MIMIRLGGCQAYKLSQSGKRRENRVDTLLLFFFSSRRRHTRYIGDWSSDVCSSDLWAPVWRFVASRVPDSLADDLTNETFRSEERRVGKECRSRWSPDQVKKKKEIDKVQRGHEYDERDREDDWEEATANNE